jgi:hypothetical protein
MNIKITASGTVTGKAFCYKLLPAEFAENMLNFGEVRISTLSYCAGIEAGRGRRDAMENMLLRQFRFGTFRAIPNDQEDQSPFREWTRSEGFVHVPFPKDAHSDHKLYVQARLMELPEIGVDMSLYCVAAHTTRRMERDQYEHEHGGSVWVEIFEPIKFFDALGLAVEAEKGWAFKGWFPIIYRSRRIPIDQPGIEGALIKESDYAAEQEVRCLWAPTKHTPLSPFNIRVKELSNYCRMYKTIEPPPPSLSKDGYLIRNNKLRP